MTGPRVPRVRRHRHRALDAARGDAVCTGCGSVLEDNIIVSRCSSWRAAAAARRPWASSCPWTVRPGGGSPGGRGREPRREALDNSAARAPGVVRPQSPGPSGPLSRSRIGLPRPAVGGSGPAAPGPGSPRLGTQSPRPGDGLPGARGWLSEGPEPPLGTRFRPSAGTWRLAPGRAARGRGPSTASRGDPKGAAGAWRVAPITDAGHPGPDGSVCV